MKWLLAVLAFSLLFAAVYVEERGRRDFDRRDTVRRDAMAAACRTANATSTELAQAQQALREARELLQECVRDGHAVSRDLDDCTCICLPVRSRDAATVDSREDR